MAGSSKRVALYCRVSTTDQNAAMQIEELRELAKRRGWSVTDQYVDEGISGTKSSRPELNRLMADARRRRFDVVMVWRFDRFARSTAHLLTALEEFRNLGIDFISHHEAIDTSTPLGKMVFTVVASVAELERSIIVERVRAGIARAKAKGTRLGRPRGSAVDRSQVRDLLAAGLPTREVARKLGIGLGSVYRASLATRKTPAKSTSSSHR